MLTAASQPTALTIRHSRFAALTLAKLVASLALHPPSSAAGSGGLRASFGSLHSPPSPQGEGFFCRAIFKKLGFSSQRSQSAKSNSRTQLLPRGTPILIGAGVRSTTEGEK